VTAPDSCPRCAQLEEQVAELTARLQFRPCGFSGPGTAMVSVTMPDGRTAGGWLCRPHQILLAPFAPRLVVGFGGREGPCGWLVPEQEALPAIMEDAAMPVAEDSEEVSA